MVLVLNVAVEWFMPLLGIQKVLDSNICTETGYPVCVCVFFYFLYLDRCLYVTLKYVMAASNLVFADVPII